MNPRDEARLFDVRTLERNLRKGLVSKKDYDKHVKALPDVTDKATACTPETQSREAVHHHRVAAAAAAAQAPRATLLIDGEDAAIDDEDDDDLEDEEEAEAEADED